MHPVHKTRSSTHLDSVDSALRSIRRMIVRGQLSPGHRVIEADIAGRLRMSRTPVRGALQLLQREGYLSPMVGMGAKNRVIVSALTLQDAAELYSIISRLEGLAGRLAAELPAAPRNEVVRELKKGNAALAKIAKTRTLDPDGVFDLDSSFHRAIVQAGAGPRLGEMHRSIQPQIERYWRIYANAILDDLSTSVEEHERIITAIACGDPGAAETALQVNWENGQKRLTRMITALGERGVW